MQVRGQPGVNSFPLFEAVSRALVFLWILLSLNPVSS